MSGWKEMKNTIKYILFQKNSNNKSKMEKEEDFDETGIINPVLIPLIIEDIFKYLGPRDIGKCRQVCSTWGLIATPIFLEHIDEIQILFSEYDADMNPQDSRVSQYCATTRNVKYTNFYLKNLNVASPAMLEFLTRFGQDIKCLKLHLEERPRKLISHPGKPNVFEYLRGTNIGPGRKFIQDILLKFCPNLVKLEVDHLPNEIVDSSIFDYRTNPTRTKIQHIIYNEIRSSPNFLADLFTMSPLLKEVELVWPGRFTNFNYIRILSLKNRLFGITSLSLSILVNTALDVLLASKDEIHLQSFSVAICTPVNMEVDLSNWLESQASTLERLSIGFDLDLSLDGNHPVIFPAMENLQELWIGLKHSRSTSTFQIANTSIIQKFPRLRKCTFQGTDIVTHISSIFGSMNKPLLTLKELNIPCGMDEQRMQKIKRLFPNAGIMYNYC